MKKYFNILLFAVALCFASNVRGESPNQEIVEYVDYKIEEYIYPDTLQKELDVYFQFKNNSEETLTGILFDVKFFDDFGDLLYEERLNSKLNVEPHALSEMEDTFWPYKDNEDEVNSTFSKLWPDVDADTIKVQVVLQKVTFHDGSIVAIGKEYRNEEFIRAAGTGDYDTVKKLIIEGIDVNSMNKKGATALTASALIGHLENVKIIVENGASVERKSAALISTVRKGHMEIMKYLIDNGADVNVKTRRKGFSVLNIAAVGSNVEAIKMLIDNGADVNLKDDSKHTALSLLTRLEKAAKTPNPRRVDTVKLLLNAGAKSALVLISAVKKGNIKGVKLLLTCGVDVNSIYCKKTNCETALYAATLSSNHELVKLLLDKGANTQIRCGSRSNTALDYATYSENKEIIKLLKEAGAKE